MGVACPSRLASMRRRHPRGRSRRWWSRHRPRVLTASPAVVTPFSSAPDDTRSTPAAVVPLATSTPSRPPRNGLVGAYGFDAGSGTTVADASGQENHGTLSGAKWTTHGRYGGALSFDGAHGLVSVADAASLDLSSGMTLEAWVYPTKLTGLHSAIVKEGNGGVVYALYGNGSAPRPSAYVRIEGKRPTGGSSGQMALEVNAWTHLAATYDGATLRLFVNGAETASHPVTGSIMASSNPLRVGGNAVWGEYFAGVIDEVRIYNRALSAAEIQDDMTTPVTNCPEVACARSRLRPASRRRPAFALRASAVHRVGTRAHLAQESVCYRRLRSMRCEA